MISSTRPDQLITNGDRIKQNNDEETKKIQKWVLRKRRSLFPTSELEIGDLRLEIGNWRSDWQASKRISEQRGVWRDADAKHGARDARAPRAQNRICAADVGRMRLCWRFGPVWPQWRYNASHDA
jgi:hypothetical protein